MHKHHYKLLEVSFDSANLIFICYGCNHICYRPRTFFYETMTGPAFSEHYWKMWNAYHYDGDDFVLEEARIQYRNRSMDYAKSYAQLYNEIFWPVSHPEPKKRRSWLHRQFTKVVNWLYSWQSIS